jgi:hypothetical protein
MVEIHQKKDSTVYSAPTAVAARQSGLEHVEFGMPYIAGWLGDFI